MLNQINYQGHMVLRSLAKGLSYHMGTPTRYQTWIRYFKNDPALWERLSQEFLARGGFADKAEYEAIFTEKKKESYIRSTEKKRAAYIRSSNQS